MLSTAASSEPQGSRDPLRTLQNCSGAGTHCKRQSRQRHREQYLLSSEALDFAIIDLPDQKLQSVCVGQMLSLQSKINVVLGSHKLSRLEKASQAGLLIARSIQRSYGRAVFPSCSPREILLSCLAEILVSSNTGFPAFLLAEFTSVS